MKRHFLTPRFIGMLWVIAQACVLAAWGIILFSLADLLQRGLRVPLLALTGGLLAVGGVILAVAGTMALGPEFTPNPEPKKKSSLVDTGLYAHLRHPIYTGVLLCVWGLTIPMLSPLLAVAALGATLFFSIKARYEEGRLRERIAGYEAYMKRTGRFFPPVGRKKTEV